MKKKTFCPLCAYYLELLKLYDVPMPCKDMWDVLGIPKHTFYYWQKQINLQLGMPTIAHSVAYCKDEGWI